MRLLVIEDDSVFREQLAGILRDEGYAVDESDDGIEGLYKIIHIDYDLILLDLTLPGLDGADVLERARRLRSNTPIFLLTAREGIGDRVHGLDLGADDYIVKGVHLAELKARVRSILRRGSRISSNVLKAGPLTLDLVTKRVKRAGKTIALTGREYSILATLMRNLDTIVSREELYHRVKDEVDDSMSNLFDVHVCRLRKKLGQNSILTVRGRGFIVQGGAARNDLSAS